MNKGTNIYFEAVSSPVIILTNAVLLGIAKVVFLTFVAAFPTIAYLTQTLACKLKTVQVLTTAHVV